jgi:hypothetical protein
VTRASDAAVARDLRREEAKAAERRRLAVGVLGQERADAVAALPVDHQLLWIAATVCYGAQWQLAIGRAIGIKSSRNVRRYALGEAPVPRRWLEFLAEQIHAHRAEAADVDRVLAQRLDERTGRA